MYTLGFILEAGSLGLFFYFIYTGYQSSLSQEFMSLDPTAGVCEAVIQPLSGTYLVDKHGNWEGTTDFRYNLAQYEFVFSNFQGTSDEYYSLLNQTYDQIIEAGTAHYANNDLAYNLALWSSFSTVVPSPNGVAQKIAMTGDDQYIFNKNDAYGVISNVNDDCDSTSVASYDGANYLLVSQSIPYYSATCTVSYTLLSV